MKVRVAAVQYPLEPVTSYEQFEQRVSQVLSDAARARPDFVLLPELFSTQLMSLADDACEHARVRRLHDFIEPYRDLLGRHARDHRYYLIGGSHPTIRDGRLYNTAYLFEPDGDVHAQDKIRLTPWEKDPWHVTPGQHVKLFQTDHGPIGILICYDIEFPDSARLLAQAGAQVIFVPSCTCDREGYLRVRTCARARAIEDQVYVVMTGTVGSLPGTSLEHNYGCAAVFTPSDAMFSERGQSEGGVAAEGRANEPDIVLADLDLDLLRAHRARGGSVSPLSDLVEHAPKPVACIEQAVDDRAAVAADNRP